MTSWKAWSRTANDAELVDLVRAFAEAATCWCFVEGPTCSEFVETGGVGDLVGSAWMVRAFSRSGEFAGRRSGFDRDQPWLLRLVWREPPPGEGWVQHEIGSGEEQVLVLYGESDGQDGFTEGRQFRDPFHYPGVRGRDGERAALVVQRHPAGEGGPIVRWVELRREPGGSSKEGT